MEPLTLGCATCITLTDEANYADWSSLFDESVEFWRTVARLDALSLVSEFFIKTQCRRVMELNTSLRTIEYHTIEYLTSLRVCFVGQGDASGTSWSK
jgi:hypothetical protein